VVVGRELDAPRPVNAPTRFLRLSFLPSLHAGQSNITSGRRSKLLEHGFLPVALDDHQIGTRTYGAWEKEAREGEVFSPNLKLLVNICR
jgi:hypothetical protein